MNAERRVHLLVPQGIDDPLRPSGGNTYDRRLCEALGESGWSVHVVEVAGAWPEAGERGRAALAGSLRTVPDGALVVVDGLVASGLPSVLVPACRRLRVVLLMHMPLGLGGDDCTARAEGEVLRAARAVLTPSDWSRSWLLAAYALDPGRVHVAHPGVDDAPPAAGSGSGGALLCVGAVTPGKGHDLLLAALSRVADLPWRCTCVGSLLVDPEHVALLRRRARGSALEDRFLLRGPLSGHALTAAYDAADVLVVPSRAETYGMVVAEGLARGLPVVAADVGGVPEALGATAGGVRPGLLVPADDVEGLAGGLRVWLSDTGRRTALRDAALRRRADLPGWSDTADRVAAALLGVAA